jgi:hypothetical protein
MTFIRKHEVIILLHDIKLFPCLINHQAKFVLEEQKDREYTDPFIKLNTEVHSVMVPKSTHGKKALILIPTG